MKYDILFTAGLGINNNTEHTELLYIPRLPPPPIFNFYGLGQIFFTDALIFFLILKMDFNGFLNGLWVQKPEKKICKN